MNKRRKRRRRIKVEEEEKEKKERRKERKKKRKKKNLSRAVGSLLIPRIIRVFWPRAGLSLQAQEPKLQFCRRQVFHPNSGTKAAVLPGNE